MTDPGFEGGELGLEEPATRPALCGPERLSGAPPGGARDSHTPRLSRVTRRGPDKASVLCQELRKHRGAAEAELEHFKMLPKKRDFSPRNSTM